MEESVSPELAQAAEPESSQDPVDTSSQGTHGSVHHMHFMRAVERSQFVWKQNFQWGIYLNKQEITES